MKKHEYIQDTKLLLQAFENSQVVLLQRNVSTACSEFTEEFRQLEAEFSSLRSDNSVFYKMPANRRLLVEKQIERLQKFIKEMKGTMKEIIHSERVEDSRIIFLFERQHLFKNILRRHVKDMVG